MYDRKPTNKKEALAWLNSVINDCKNHKNWNLYDDACWQAMIDNLKDVKLWIKEDVSYKGIWEVRK